MLCTPASYIPAASTSIWQTLRLSRGFVVLSLLSDFFVISDSLRCCPVFLCLDILLKAQRLRVWMFSISTSTRTILSYNCIFVMSSPVNTEETARPDIDDILGRYNIVWRDGDAIRPEPRPEWNYEEHEDVPTIDAAILLSLAIDETSLSPSEFPPRQPGTTPVVGHLVWSTWRAKWTGTYSPRNGLRLQVESMNDDMTNGVYKGCFCSCSLKLYSRDDSGFAFLIGDFAMWWTDCPGTSDGWIRIFAKKKGPVLHLTASERRRCKTSIEEAEKDEKEDDNEDEDKEGDRSDAAKDKSSSGQQDTKPEARTELTDILGRYNAVWKYETLGGSEEVSWPDHTVTISRAPTQEATQIDPPLEPGETALVAELLYGSWRGRWFGAYSKGGGLGVGVEDMNKSMNDNIHEQCSLDLYSLDDDGFAFVHCEFDTGSKACSGSSLELLLKKHGRSLELTQTEKERCRDVIGESEDEMEERRMVGTWGKAARENEGAAVEAEL